MEQEKPYRLKSIREYHELRGLSKPEHPLISLVNMKNIKHRESSSLVLDYYSISLKRGLQGNFKCGQQEYDFDAGVMFFIAPNQVFKVETDIKNVTKQSGWLLLIHPDFFWSTTLAKKIKHYDFFDYSANEALFLSDKEEKTLNGIIENIKQEYHSNIDKFSKDIIVSHIETLLNYSERFYNRQFLTREKTNHHILERLEQLINDYFKSDELISKGLPTVHDIAEHLNVSPSYLSNLLRALTGQNTQQHIHDKLIENAKEKLSSTNLTISEIAYELGFEYPASFSKLFKNKTNSSPSEFRKSFN